MTSPGGAVERRVLAAVDEEGLLRCVADLVAIPSVSGEETPAQERVAAEMADFGLEVDRWELDLPALRGHPAYAVDVERNEGLGVVGTMGRGEGRTLILNGHIDVVPAGEPGRWTCPPWRATRKGGRLYGRGTADTKGGLSCALFAAKAIREAGVGLEGALQVQSVIGEEDGGVGTLATIVRGHRGDGAVVLEPTRLAVAPAQAGALGFRIAVEGRAAHGAFREEGVDPVEKFLPLHRAIRRFEGARNREVGDPLFADDALPFAIAIGTVRAGIWPSTVAERLVCEGRFGVAPGEDPVAARRAFEEALGDAAEADPWLRDHPPAVEWRGAQFEAARTPADDPVVEAVRGAYEAVAGGPAELRGMRYGADMRLLVNEAGIPSVLFGPGDVREAHRPDESVPIEELLTATRTLALAALRFCGVRSR